MSHSDEAFTWTAEEAEHAHSQSGASNCGATALLNVLSALKVPVPSINTAEQAVHTNSRRCGVGAVEYLQARSVAGSVAAGARTLAGKDKKVRTQTQQAGTATDKKKAELKKRWRLGMQPKARQLPAGPCFTGLNFRVQLMVSFFSTPGRVQSEIAFTRSWHPTAQ